MEEREQIKTQPRSFRISEDVNEKLKSISNQIGGNQQDLFEQLISAYESRQVEETLGSRKEDYAAVVKLLDTVKSKYISAVLEADDADEIANAKYEKELRNREKTIIAQQDKIGSLEERIRQQDKELEGITGLREDVRDKREECRKLSEENEKLKETAGKQEEQLRSYQKAEIDQRNSLSTVRTSYAELQADSRADKDTIAYLQIENRMQLQQEYADKEREYFSKLEEEIKLYRQQADDYKDKYINLLEKQVREKK